MHGRVPQPDEYESSTVEALINTLKTLPPDTLVVISADEEGNRFSPLMGADLEAVYDLSTEDLAIDTGDPEYPYLEADGVRRRKSIILYPGM